MAYFRKTFFCDSICQDNMVAGQLYYNIVSGQIFHESQHLSGIFSLYFVSTLALFQSILIVPELYITRLSLLTYLIF